MIGTILLSIFFGIILTLLVQYIFFRYRFKSLPIVTDKWKSQSDPFVLPQELLNIFENLNVQEEKESYKSLNFIFQFLFQELKDADHVRKWAMKKLKNEFSELLQSTTGKLLDEIRIRGFNLGRTFPIVKNVSLSNVSVNEDHTIDEVSLLLDLAYNGRFQLAVDVGMVFGKSAYLSVTVTKLQGTARLQFSTIPYRHWSFAFTKDPILEFEVDSHFEGRPIARLASVITNQIKRQVRKKHTLPNYKIRYKPFFVMPTQKVEPKDIFYRNMKLSIGKMNVVVVGCTRLLVTPPGSFIFCSLAIDSMPWSELMEIKKKSCSHFDCEIFKSSPHLGLVFEDEFSVEKFEEVVVVTSISIGSPAHKAGIHKNDVIVSINGTKVASSKQAFRIIKQSAEKALIRVERDVSPNLDVPQAVQQMQIKKVPSMDSLTGLAKDLGKKDATLSKGSQESLSTPNHVERSPGHSEGSQLRSASSAQSMTLEGRDKEPPSVVMSSGKSEEAFVENLLTYNPTKSEDLNIGEPKNGESVVKKTRDFKSCQNPVFNQRFKFDVKEHHNYLNICVWCREVEKVDKQLKVTKVEKDTLLGHVSISLMDVALECSTTLQGDFTNSFNLIPSQSKIGMGRQQYAAISTHPGFEDRLCHGDILLRFHYSREDDNFEHNFDIFDNIHMENSNPMTQSRNEKASKKLHHFQPAQFQSAVHCKFCSKKIWFKSAFMCSGCNMVCHKKCIEKCQQQTTCVRAPRTTDSGGGSDGVDENECEIGERKRHKSAPDDQKKAAEASNQPLPPQLNNLARKSSSSSLKDISAAEASTDNSESSTCSKMKRNQYWKANEENADEKIVTAAKSIGKQLYIDLDLELRKEKFDEVILTTQIEIERENKHQTDLQLLDKKTVDKKMKAVLKDKIKNSEEKLKSLKILMLQYCAGLQHCLDEEESLRQRKASQIQQTEAELPDSDPQMSEPIFSEETNVDNLEVESMGNCDFEECVKSGELEIEDYLGGGESQSELVKHQLVDSFLKDEDDVRSDSELLEVQALLESHQSSETSSQKSIGADTSPEDDYLPDSFVELLDLSRQPIVKSDDVLCESASGLSIEGCFDDGSSEINCRLNVSEDQKKDGKSQSQEGKVRFEL